MQEVSSATKVKIEGGSGSKWLRLLVLLVGRCTLGNV